MRKIKIILTFVSVLISFFVGAQTDKYDINDPRNPNCPCHKYQKLADEEYKNILAMNNKNIQVNSNPLNQNFSPNQLVNDEKKNMSSETANLSKNESDHKAKHHSKRRIKKHNSFRRILDRAHWNFWKRNPITDACSHW